ncbi:hypothetical protein HGRIS_006573 [Hohenbuehelia grisea]|uniref:NmrA-like domain-containing protein n=1 Tax=Hohenbuehelia grisea TaxID=104357 RepID=A0ABR3J9Z7_9AGAR
MASNGKSPLAKRNILVTAGEGNTGRAILECLMEGADFKGKYASVSALVFSDDDDDLVSMGVTVLPYEKIKDSLVKEMTNAKIDTVLLIPPARKDKMRLSKVILEAAKATKAVTNLVLLSSAGCDLAERHNQPRLREFIDLEALAMQPKSLPETGDTGHSPVIVRAGFYAENLLLYTKQAQGQGQLPIPIDAKHKFSPVALGDVARVCAYILTSQGPHGIADEVRGQLIVLTGPMMVAGAELAEAASQALGTRMEFKSITESQAKKIFNSDQGEEVDETEKEYLLEYYSLVREGKTAYVSDIPFVHMFGEKPQAMPEFFKAYSSEFKPKKRRTK